MQSLDVTQSSAQQKRLAKAGLGPQAVLGTRAVLCASEVEKASYSWYGPTSHIKQNTHPLLSKGNQFQLVTLASMTHHFFGWVDQHA
jgi:hypothetical protein